MKLEKSCETCFDNTRGCSFMLSSKCVENNYFDWEPFTYGDYIRSMSGEEMAEFFYKHRAEIPSTEEEYLKWLNTQVRGD